MDPLSMVVDKLKSLSKSGEDFVSGLVGRRKNVSSQNPIQILKRLQREAFADIMKLRDRQDKVERMLSFYRTSNSGPFQEGRTHVKGEVDCLGALLLTDNSHEQNSDELSRAGIRTGIMSRIAFQAPVRQNDILEMEFITSQQNQDYSDDTSVSALSLSKLCYTATITDWLSLVAIPIGGRCRDIAGPIGSCQERGLTEYSSYGPPLLNSQNGGAVGLTVRKSNVVASLAQFNSSLGNNSNSCGDYLSTFGQIVTQLPRSTKLSLSGVHRVPKPKQPRNLGGLTIPLGILKRKGSLDTSMEPPMEVRSESISTGSVALMVESEVDEYTKLNGWVQLQTSNPRCIQWSLGLSDSPKEDEVGWGLSLGGASKGPANRDHFQVEAFLKLNVAKNCTLQPGFVYVMEGANRMPAVMFRSSWNF